MTTTSDLDIAVIGLSCEFAGNASLEAYWQMMLERQCAVRTLDAFEMQARGAAGQTGAEGIIARIAALRDMAGFDNRKFGFSPHEANIADPQLRLLLKHASHALKSSGYDPAVYWGEIGVFGSASISLEWAWEVRDSLGGRPLGIAELPYVERDFYMTRMAYHLGLRGPAVLVNTACSSSHAAIHMAVQSLLAGDCDMALACASSVRPFWGGYPHQEGGFFSPSGQCLPFCDGADGTVPGEGAAVLVLKRLETALEDGDKVFCVIKSSALNNDGNQKPGYAGPSELGQSAVIEAALAAAGIAPERLAYVECHGTGTRLGDPIEISALKRALKRWGKSGPLQIGSVKANIGHTDVVAGFAGLIKAALVLHYRTVPPQILASELNALCRFDDGAFELAHQAQALGEGRLCAGISSFGIGGTNGYVVIEGGDADFLLPPAAPEAAHRFDDIIRRRDARRAGAAPLARAMPGPAPSPDDAADTAAILEVLAEHSGERDLNVQSRLQDLGLDSISVVMITEALATMYGAAPTPARFVELVTVADLVAAVRARAGAGTAAPVPATPEEAPTSSPLTLSQRRYFYPELADPGTECYTAVFRVSAKVPEARIRKAIAQTIMRHQGLRVRFAPDSQGHWLAHYTDYPADGYFAVLDHDDAGEFDIDACRVQVAAGMRFDHGALLCARLVRQAGKDPLLLLFASHVIYDGNSLAPIFKDLLGYFGDPAYSPPPVTPVALYANYQNSWFEATDARKERDYWERDEWTQARALPVDAEAGVAGYGQDEYEQRHYLTEEASAALVAQLKQHKVAMLDLILYAVAEVYLEEAGGDWLQVACTLSGRADLLGASGLDFSDTVGFLGLCGLLLLQRPRGGNALEQIADIKRQMSAIPAKGARYFVGESHAGAQQELRMPAYNRQLGVNFLGYEGHNPNAVDRSELAFERELSPPLTGIERWYRMSLMMGFTDGRFFAQCSYSSVQYQRATIERYLDGILRRMQGFANDPA
jgi:3-oxoacyl-(acyl-carrier-protein) synthase/acyl carrier protein